VCVGRLARQKGQDVAIEALALMRTRSAHLRLVGDGPDRAALEALAAACGVADRVEFAGNQPSTAPHYRAADVVVVPSRWDGLSLGLLEAMACGAAVVASAVAGARVVVGAGLTVPPGDAVALAAALDDLVGDPGRRRAMGRAARDRVVADHALERSLAANLDLWERVARPDRGRH
jgi:glycosyltransferase involved in cell wall biosynthesis